MVNRKLFRSTLTEVKEQYPQRPAHGPQPQQQPPRKKPAPPDQTFAENFYYVKQMQAHTPVAIECYDRDCIKLTRLGSPNLMIYKHTIKYLFKDGDDAALGGNGNGQG